MTMPKSLTTVALSAVLLLPMVGCGGGAAHAYDQRQVIDAAQLIGNGPWHTQEGCEVAVVMTNKAQVELYKDAGDAVRQTQARRLGSRSLARRRRRVSENWRSAWSSLADCPRLLVEEPFVLLRRRRQPPFQLLAATRMAEPDSNLRLLTEQGSAILRPSSAGRWLGLTPGTWTSNPH